MPHHKLYNWRSTKRGNRVPFAGLLVDTPLEQVETEEGEA